MLRSLYSLDLKLLASCHFNKTASILILTKLELERISDFSLMHLLKFQVGEQKNLLELCAFNVDPPRMVKPF